MVEARARAVAVWLFVLCGMVWVMVVLGGTTRLTGSGLSIMEWHPLSGVLPPLDRADWERLFALYRQIPQYRLEHLGMTLAGFQQIFWLEWVHRLWGRLMGLVLLIPLIWFAARRLISRRLLVRLGLIFLLGGVQGAVGWFMVASGFMAGSTSVSAYRLVVHLSLALALYSALLWTALSVWQPTPIACPEANATRLLARALAVLLPVTIIAGGFMAGLHAGLTYNTFPLMDGRLFPKGYAALPWPRDWFENIAAVQFDHRLLATASLFLAAAVVFVGWRSRARSLRPVLIALGGLVAVQYALGVTTLLYAVPVPLAAAHQACAVLLLTAVLTLLHATRGAVRTAVAGRRQAALAGEAAGARP